LPAIGGELALENPNSEKGVQVNAFFASIRVWLALPADF
jgi:hypothetical protein